MPKLDKRLTDTVARKLPQPAANYELFWCADDPGFGLRVTSAGARAWIMERRVDGKTVRRTLGKASGAGAISSDAARKLKIDTSSELQQGIDRSAQRREAAKVEKVQAVTLAEALQTYVKRQRRAKDGLPLKERTKADYLGMLEPGKPKKDGSFGPDGGLYALAKKSIHKITAKEINDLYEELSERSQRQATYAMQVLRAVFNWHGVRIPDNPLSKDVAGKNRIKLPGTTGKPSPIPPEYLGAWWRAACNAGSSEVGGSTLAGDYYRFRLLTGTRGVEVLGDTYGNEPIKVRDVDLVGGRIRLSDTKNRSDHLLLLSKQALEIAARNVEGRRPTERLFPVADPRRTLQCINKAAGLPPGSIQGHHLRATFASVAEELVSTYTLKRMINHADGGDVTGAHYIGKGENQLRTAWQIVADFIESQAQISEEQTADKSQKDAQ